jgi:hypothetical protein
MVVAVWSSPYEVLGGTLGTSELTLPEEKGVYLWVLPSASTRRVQYIGYSENVRQRQYTHIVRALGGGDWVPEFPVTDAVKWRYYPQEKMKSWTLAYRRLQHHITDFPHSVEATLQYLKVSSYLCGLLRMLGMPNTSCNNASFSSLRPAIPQVLCVKICRCAGHAGGSQR